MISLKRTARIAGLWYLGFSLGPFYLLYVPSQTVVHNNAAATAARVLSHETLFRWGMLAETLGAVIFIGLSLALYRLFEPVLPLFQNLEPPNLPVRAYPHLTVDAEIPGVQCIRFDRTRPF
jgi:hypothetical protein